MGRHDVSRCRVVGFLWGEVVGEVGLSSHKRFFLLLYSSSVCCALARLLCGSHVFSELG